MPPKAAPHSDFGNATRYSTLRAKHGKDNFSLVGLRKALTAVNSRAEKEILGKNEYARIGSLEQAHVDAVAGGDPVVIAAALASLNTAQNAYKRMVRSKKGQDIPTAALRRRWDRDRRDALAYYEDFLFYQSPVLRREVAEKVPKNEVAIARRLASGEWVRGLWYDPENDIGRSHAFLVAWKDQKVGGPTDRRNATHDILHTFVPNPRRKATGVGKPHWPKLRPDRSNQVLTIRTNDEDIEDRRLEIEAHRGSTRVDANVTHDIRRKAEITSKVVEDDMTLSEALQHTRNRQTGLYISAKERPTDWPVSYDCLDKAKSGFICIDPRTVIRNYEIEERMRVRELGREDGENVDGDSDTASGQTMERVENLLLSTQWCEATYGRREFHAHGHLPPSSPVDSPPHSPCPPVYEEEDYDPTVDDESVTSDSDVPAAVPLAVPEGRTRGDAKRVADAAKDAAEKINAKAREIAKRKNAPERHAKKQNLERRDRSNDSPKKHIPDDIPEDDDRYEGYRRDFTDHYGIQNPQWASQMKVVPYQPVDTATHLQEQFDRFPQSSDESLNALGRYKKPAAEGTSMRIVRDILLGKGITAHAATGKKHGMDDSYREPKRNRSIFLAKPSTSEVEVEDTGAMDNNDGSESEDEGDLFTISYQAGSGIAPGPAPVIHPNDPPDDDVGHDTRRRYSNSGFENVDEDNVSRKRQRVE